MSVQSHYGFDVPLEKFGPKLRGLDNKLRCCLGSKHVHIDSCNWYGIIDPNTGNKVSLATFSLCSFCAENHFQPHEIYTLSPDEDKVFREQYGNSSFNCDMFCRPSLIQYNLLHKRVTEKNGMQVNVNVINPENINEWSPALIPYTNETINAQMNGCHIAQIPSHCGFGIVLKIDPDGMYNDSDYCFQIKEIKDGTGRPVTVTTSSGSSNFYNPSGTDLCIRGYKTGVSGEKFFFVAPTQHEKNQGEVAEHHGESTKFNITVNIHKKVLNTPVYR